MEAGTGSSLGAPPFSGFADPILAGEHASAQRRERHDDETESPGGGDEVLFGRTLDETMLDLDGCDRNGAAQFGDCLGAGDATCGEVGQARVEDLAGATRSSKLGTISPISVTLSETCTQYTFDARHDKRRVGRIVIARGRDATDVAISTSFGTALLAQFDVHTDVVADDFVPKPAI